MSKVYHSIAELVGHTPLLEIHGFEKKHNLKAKILVKLEYFNPNQSVKDRIALAMIEDGENSQKTILSSNSQAETRESVLRQLQRQKVINSVFTFKTRLAVNVFR